MRTIFIADLHSPFTDTSLLSNVLKIPCDRLIIGGDFLDCYSISRFPGARKERAESFAYEISCGLETLKKIRNLLKTQEIIYIKGNHEERLDKLLNSKLKQFRDLQCLQIPELLRLNELGIRYYKTGYDLTSNFYVYHGFRTALQSARKEFEYYIKSGCSGHVHRSNKHIKPTKNGIFEWYSVGTMANISELDYAKQFKYNWDNGFLVLDTYGNHVEVTQIIPQKDKSFYFEGKKYEVS